MKAKKANSNTAVGYVRVSTTEQARTGISIPDQEARIKAYCEANGLHLVEIFRDGGVSAGIRLSDRPAGARLVEAIGNGADHLVALKLDRLFRNVLDCLGWVERWNEKGKALHLLDFGGTALNTKTAMGKAFMTVSAAFGELERGLASERIQNAMERMVLEGRWTGGPLPMGYRYRDPENDDHTIEIDEDDAEIVRLIFDLRAAGNGPDKIASILYAKGIKGNQGSRRFSPTSVKRIYRNTSYINERHHKGEIYPAGLPTFLDRELWEKVNAVGVRQEAKPKGRYIMTGLITCSLCEGPMSHKPAVAGHKAEYQCTGRKVWKDCKGVSVGDHLVEPLVLEQFFKHVESEEYDKAVALQAKKARKPRSLDAEIAKVQARQDKVLELYVGGGIDRAALDRKVGELTDQLTALQAEKTRLEADQVLPPKWEGNIREDWEFLNIDERRQALSLFIERVVIQPGRGRERVEIQWR